MAAEKRYKALTDLVVGGKAQAKGSTFSAEADGVRHALVAGLVEEAKAASTSSSSKSKGKGKAS
jgi:hypothetical protein